MKRLLRFASRWPSDKQIRVACYLAIPALLLMAWSVAVPTALPVVIGMSVGQGLGAVAFVLYALVVIGDAALAYADISKEPDEATTSDVEPKAD